ncbi:hypothetical protein [Rubrivirga sp.]|uniref:hypothetical protein n=1 Tax=Rubrivirga sp. TaxID=1885344 RepID=UPI003C72920E
MPKRYSEEEAQRIFALVADRQRAGAGPDGLSLSELEEAARAAGLDPSLVAIAAAELEAAPHAERTLLGVPVEVIRSRVLTGTLDENTWAEIVGAARSEFGEPGIAGQVGRLREWTLISSNGTKSGTVTRLTAEPVDGGFRVTVSKSIRDTIVGFAWASGIQLVMAVVFLVLFLAGADPEIWIPAAMMAGMGTMFAVGSHVVSRFWKQPAAGRFARLLERVALVARHTAPSSVGSEPRRASPDRVAPVVDLEALEDPALEAGPADRRRART